jgi:hypothetical protein
VIAGAGTRRCFHLAEQCVHFFLPKLPAGAHRAVARHGSGDFVEALLQRIGGVSLGDLADEIAEPWPPHRLSKSEATGYHSAGAESISDDIQPLAPGETSRANRDSELPLHQSISLPGS